MSNAFEGLRDSIFGSYPPPKQEPLTMKRLTEMIVQMCYPVPAPIQEIVPPEHFYVTDPCQEHEDCILVTCYPWQEGPARSVQHMRNAKWQEAMALSDWTHAPLELAPAWYRKRVKNEQPSHSEEARQG